MTTNDLYELLWSRQGMEHQITIAIEELSELQKELCKKLRTGLHMEEIAYEIADVKICIEQLELMLGLRERVAKARRVKLERLLERVQEDKDL